MRTVLLVVFSFFVLMLTLAAAFADPPVERSILKGYYDQNKNITYPSIPENAGTNRTLPDGRLNLAVFPPMQNWTCEAYKGVGETECATDRCIAIMELKNFTGPQVRGLCGTRGRP